MHSIRALYLQPAAHFGGAERQAATIVPLLSAHGVETTPLVGPGREIVAWLGERGVDDVVHTNTFPGAWRKPRGIGRVALVWRYARCLRLFRSELAAIVRDREIDVIYAAMAYSWFAATPVARRLAIPIVWRAGGTECSGGARRILGIASRWFRPDQLVCNGDSVRALYAPLIGSRSIVIRNGLDARQFYPGAGDGARLRPPGVHTVIGFAGRLVAQKRPEDFIAVAARFGGHRDVGFLFAGDGSRRAYYAETAQRAGARTLRVTGYLHDMRDFYAACDVLVLPSRSEGCPNVVLEAMAMGTVVVAADAPATREIVTDGRDGILYPVGDLDALERALASLVGNPDQRRMLVERGYRRVSRLTAHECAARTAEVLRAVVASHSRARLPATPRRTALPA